MGYKYSLEIIEATGLSRKLKFIFKETKSSTIEEYIE